MTKLSNTALNLYNQCSLCYYLHYKENIRPVKTSSALVFGSALDSALNELLKNRNLNDAQNIFEDEWNKYKKDTNIIYFKSDLDEELLNYFGFFTDNIKIDPNWKTLLIKGRMFIEAYYLTVLPKIKEVLAIQEPIEVQNSEGDKITGFLDLVIKWEDGKTYLMDNKSSSKPYENDSAKEGQQLPLYHYAVKEKYNLNGIGYIVLIKKINKNKVKKCINCNTINNTSHKKCPQLLLGHIDNEKNRCNGEFAITINPSVAIQYVFNKVEETDENRVLELFDQANHAISNNIFATRHNPQRGKYGYCPYKKYFEGSPDFIKKEKV